MHVFPCLIIMQIYDVLATVVVVIIFKLDNTAYCYL